MNTLGQKNATEVNSMARGQLILLKLEVIRLLQSKPEQSSGAIHAEGRVGAQ